MTDFLETPEWINLSKKIRIRDKKCLRCGSKHRLCADHVIPRSRRRDLSLKEFNLQTLCWKCNTIKKNKYIVSYLDRPDEKLLNEIAIEKTKIRLALYQIARSQIYKKDINQRGLINNKFLDEFENEYNLITLGVGQPKQEEREGVLHGPLNILRFFGMGFSLLGSLAITITREANNQYGKYKITEEEISEYLDKEIDVVFSDWGSRSKNIKSEEIKNNTKDHNTNIKIDDECKSIESNNHSIIKFSVIEENSKYRIYSKSVTKGFSITLCEYKPKLDQCYIAYIRNKKWNNIDYIAIEGTDLNDLNMRAINFTYNPDLSETYVKNNGIKVFHTPEFTEEQSTKARDIRLMLLENEDDESRTVEY